ncbi:MAG: hypothetical protein AAGK02_08735 [Pseudomonadota bacterium]
MDQSKGRGTFIISLDCEGKWGMADHLGPWHHEFLRREHLIPAYQTLVDLFGRYEMPATFAFVMGFVLDPDEQTEMAAHFVDTEIEGANWLVDFRKAQIAGDHEGWSCPEVLEVVRNASLKHEVACHGFTHVPLSEDLVGRDLVERELSAAKHVAEKRGIALETLVYPRNLVGHTGVLAETGFSGYRQRPPVRGKAGALLAELNPIDRSQLSLPKDGELTVVPSGEMLNWQSGPRKLIPRAASRLRWKARLEDAAKSGGVAHIWLHPHNIIDAPGTLERLEDVLGEAARLRDAGKLVVKTQAEYCAAP